MASRSGGAAQPIPDGPHREDRRWVTGTAELAAQVADVHVDDVRRRIVLIAPHGAEDLLARDDLAVVAHEVDEQLELRRRQGDRLAAAAHLAAEQIDLDAP